MRGTVLSSLSDVIDQVDSPDKTLLLVNLTGTSASILSGLLEEALDEQSVTVADRHVPDGRENLVCLVEDGEVVATTPWAELERAYLQVNADRYRTGTKQTERGSFPDVLTGLDEVEFTVRGFPHSNTEKLLLVLISRFIEFRALSHGAGELHAFFQSLSRMDDERGTYEMYERLADTDVSVHVYGVPDDPTVAEELGVTVHASTDREVRQGWIVSFSPPDGADATPAALVAEEVDPNVWRGTWTYDPDLVSGVRSYVRRRF